MLNAIANQRIRVGSCNQQPSKCSADPRIWGLRFFLGFTLLNPQTDARRADYGYFLQKSRRPQRRRSDALRPLLPR